MPAITPDRKTLDVLLKSMKDSRRVSRFLSSLGRHSTEIDNAVAEIIARAVAENAAVSSNDLDSEMESEREQEQEQEQEREQQAVAITARDKAEETRWPIKLLHDGMQASGSVSFCTTLSVSVCFSLCFSLCLALCLALSCRSALQRHGPVSTGGVRRSGHF